MNGQMLKKRSLLECLADASILENALFILNQGDALQIRECAASGACMLLPNMLMGHSLIFQTILRQAKPKLVLSQTIWDKLQPSFEMHTANGWAPELVIFEHFN